MKILLVVALLTNVGSVYANDQAAEAFATGFANAINRRLGGNPNDGRQVPAQQVEVYQAPPIRTNSLYAMRNDGSTGPRFFDYASCHAFVRRTFGFVDCAYLSE